MASDIRSIINCCVPLHQGEKGGVGGGIMPSYSGVTYSAKSEPDPDEEILSDG